MPTPSPPRPTNRRLGWSLVVALNLGLLALAVALLRGRAEEARIDEPVVPAAVGRFDRWLGWSLRPDARATSRRLLPPIEYRINAAGLRADRELPLAAEPGTRRVVLVGDSNTFGYGVPLEQHFGTLLERQLEDVEVVNLGVSAYGVDQELLRLRYEGLRYAPDLVVAYVPHYAEFRHMNARRWGRDKPRFVREGEALVLVGAPVPREAERGPETAGGQAAQDRRDARDPAFVAELHALGSRIVLAMRDAAAEAGAEFLLVTKIAELRDAALDAGVHVLDVRTVLADPALHLPEGLGHLSAAGNAALCAHIADHVEAHELLAAGARRAPRPGLRVGLRVRAEAPAAAFGLELDGAPIEVASEVTTSALEEGWTWLRFEWPQRALPRGLTVLAGANGAAATDLRLSVLEVNGRWLRPEEGRARHRGDDGPVRLEFDLRDLGVR